MLSTYAKFLLYKLQSAGKLLLGVEIAAPAVLVAVDVSRGARVLPSSIHCDDDARARLYDVKQGAHAVLR